MFDKIQFPVKIKKKKVLSKPGMGRKLSLAR